MHNKTIFRLVSDTTLPTGNPLCFRQNDLKEIYNNHDN